MGTAMTNFPKAPRRWHRDRNQLLWRVHRKFVITRIFSRVYDRREAAIRIILNVTRTKCPSHQSPKFRKKSIVRPILIETKGLKLKGL